MDHENIFDIFERTIINCRFYEDSNNMHHLYSEIGCARGIFYCIENLKLVDLLDVDLFNEYFAFIEKYSEDLIMTNKVTGIRISDKALYILKYYCLQYGFNMSKVIEQLIFENLQLPGSKLPEASENAEHEQSE